MWRLRTKIARTGKQTPGGGAFGAALDERAARNPARGSFVARFARVSVGWLAPEGHSGAPQPREGVHKPFRLGSQKHLIALGAQQTRPARKIHVRAVRQSRAARRLLQ
jgi:hypothetical protein